MNSSLDTEESGESTEIQEFTETAVTRDMGEPSGTLTPRRSEGIKESGESTETAITQDTGEPSGTRPPRKSEGIEESGEFTGIAGNQEPTDTPTTGASTDAESLKAQTGEESAPLNSQTGALVPVVYSTSSALLRWLWSYIYPGWYSYISSRLPDWQYYRENISSRLPDWQWFGSWFGSPASHTHEEEPGNEDDEGPDNGCDVIVPSEDGLPLLSQFKGNEDDEGPDNGCDVIVPSEDGLPLLSQFKGNEDDEGPGDGFDIIDAREVALVSRKSFQENIDKIREIIKSTFSTPPWYFGTHHTVGIFSRSSESDYEWLISELKSKPFQSSVSIVRPHYICNSKHKFREAVSQDTFGILYHTKNRGRLNIVDVTDSLYDEELKYLSERLGRENVIVVVDDLEDNGDGEKTRILECQPSIVKLAREIFLFSANDKPVMTSVR